MRTTLAPLLALLLAACASGQPVIPQTAVLPTNAFGGGLDPDVTASNLAVWAFSDSGRTYGRPVEGARASAALMYLAGQIYTSPRWSNVSALTKEELLQGRRELRTALDAAPDATAQQIVTALVGAGTALAADDRSAAIRSLTTPAFPAGGEATLAKLANLPYMRMANVSTQHLENELFDDSGDQRF